MDSRLFAMPESDSTVGVYRTTDWQRIASIVKTPTLESGFNVRFGLSPDKLFISDSLGTHLYDLTLQATVWFVVGKRGPMDVSLDGKYVAVGGTLLDSMSGNVLGVAFTNGARVFPTFSPTSQEVLFCNSVNPPVGMLLYRLPQFVQVGTFPGSNCYSSSFLKETNSFAMGWARGTVHTFFGMDPLRWVTQAVFHQQYECEGVATGVPGAMCVAAGPILLKINLASPKEAAPLIYSHENSAIANLDVNQNLWICNSTSTSRVPQMVSTWTTETGRLLGLRTIPGLQLVSGQTFMDGTRAVVIRQDFANYPVEIRSLPDLALIKSVGYSTSGNSIRFLSKSQRLCDLTIAGNSRVVDLETNTFYNYLQGRLLAFSPDEQSVLVVGSSGVSKRRLADGAQQWLVPVGAASATWLSTGNILLLPNQSGSPILILDENGNTVRTIALPIGARFGIASDDGHTVAMDFVDTIRFFDVPSGTEFASVWHPFGISGSSLGRFSSDGTKILVRSQQSQVVLRVPRR
jgi:hypothetical protein